MGAQDFPDYGTALLRTVLLLGVLCVAAWLLLRWLARRQGGALKTFGASRALRVAARCPLDPTHALYLVEVAGRYFLLGTADGSIARLADVDGYVEPEPAAPPQRRFLDLLLARPGTDKAAESTRPAPPASE